MEIRQRCRNGDWVWTISKFNWPNSYCRNSREPCDRHGALFLLDEVMCGIGRTGKMHAWQWEGLSSLPNIQVNGKGLGGGYAPLAAVLVSAKVVDVFAAGSGAFNNVFSYQSHAVGCWATLEILKVIKEDGLAEQCYQCGLFLEKILKEQLSDHPHVGDIRLVAKNCSPNSDGFIAEISF